MARHLEISKKLFDKLLSEDTKEKSERVIIYITIVSFLLHLFVIFLVDMNIIHVHKKSPLLTNPIAAIYTPFSFILVYEVYLLIYYLPKSISTYIGKQYEIITLILIRRLFKDLSHLELSSNWFHLKYDLQFTYDVIATPILFLLIFLFYRLSQKKVVKEEDLPDDIQSFIRIKKLMAVILVPILVILAFYSFSFWILGNFTSLSHIVVAMKNINHVFFDQFFTILILVDVLLLLFSFTHSDQFNIVIRNSGFIISTILLRLSFSVTGLMNIILILVAVTFGLVILWIHNQYDKNSIYKS